MIRTRLGSWHTLFLAAVGVAPFGCGGATSAVEMSPASGGTGVAGGSGGVGVTGGSGGTDPGRAAWNCTNPKTLTGVDTGYVQCAEGYIHRTKQVACPSIYPRTGSQLPADAMGGAGGTAGAAGIGGNIAGSLDPAGSGGARFACVEDADCKTKPNGHCASVGGGTYPGNLPTLSRTVCEYGCVTDQDCGAGTICECGSDVGRCVRATCRTDADCGEGSLCAGANYNEVPPCTIPYRSSNSYSCQVPGDQCFTSLQCEGFRTDRDTGMRTSCKESETNRTCVTRPAVACGRPFCVKNVHRQANLDESAGWIGSSVFVGSAREFEQAVRLEIATHYTEIALMEHASVAAFARFSLHLMSMGAPAWLLSETQRAMGDEIEHAKACFALASSYANSSVGPSRLRLEGAFEDSGVLDIIVTAVKETCFGETVAAIEAAEAASVATVPAVRELLSRISDDETRHAELGWRFLAWALENAGASERGALTAALREILRAEVAEANQQVRVESGEIAQAATLAAHGIISPASRTELRRAVLKDVVAPVLNSLLEASNGAEPKLMTEMAGQA